MQKRALFATGILVLCAAGAVGYYQFNKPHQSARDITPVSNLAAAALFSFYQTNEPGADKQYLGKVIQVSGVVSEINQADTAASLVLGSGSGGGVNCSFQAGGAGNLKKVQVGDSVSCKGICTGFLMDVNLSDCVLVTNAATAIK